MTYTDDERREITNALKAVLVATAEFWDALRSAEKKGYKAVEDVCRAAVREWDEIGAWPDNWNLFQRTLDDAAFAAMRAGEAVNCSPRLEDL